MVSDFSDTTYRYILYWILLTVYFVIFLVKLSCTQSQKSLNVPRKYYIKQVKFHCRKTLPFQFKKWHPSRVTSFIVRHLLTLALIPLICTQTRTSQMGIFRAHLRFMWRGYTACATELMSEIATSGGSHLDYIHREKLNRVEFLKIKKARLGN